MTVRHWRWLPANRMTGRVVLQWAPTRSAGAAAVIELSKEETMNTDLIAKTWDSLRPDHLTMINSFYTRFFARFPEYRPLFPTEMDRHMRRMVDTMAMVSRLADCEDIIESRMMQVGERHRDYRLGREDMDNFRDVFIEVLAEQCRDRWSRDCQSAWTEAFDRVVLPILVRGLHQHASAATN
jgi:hemoglobin-like flavoprotein